MQNKKILKIFIGTNNDGKLKEIRDLLPKSTKIYPTMCVGAGDFIYMYNRLKMIKLIRE